ncbi:MAG: efflux RND transporter periplasmic adaptor subunit [Bacteroidales bacterium]|nr:efflux RND transporter periplasmic adaptor subunit [Bacteroidales bacterium]
MNIRILKFVFPGFAVALGLSLGACHREQNELAHHHHHHGAEAAEHAEHDHDHSHHEGEEHHHHEADEHGNEEEEHEAAAHSHEGEIVLSPEKAMKLGVAVTEVVPGTFAEVVTVSGELTAAPSAQSTVAARSAGIVTLTPAATPGAVVSRGQTIATVSGQGMAGGDSNEAASVVLKAAKRELDRLTPLHKDGIVSTRDYNAALQAYESAKATAGSSSTAGGSVATAPTSGTVTALLVSQGQYVDAGTPIAQIAASSALNLCASLPERMIGFLPNVKGAKFRTAYSDVVYDVADFNGRRTAEGATTVADKGYFPVYFTLSNDGSLSSGSFCEVYLTGGERDGVISVPVAAISEQQGKYFVYVQEHDDAYEKRPVILGADAGDRVEIASGLEPGDKVVTDGVTFVRLAETSGAIPEGHSHSH